MSVQGTKDRNPCRWGEEKGFYVRQFGNIQIEESGIRIILLFLNILSEGFLGGGSLILEEGLERVPISKINETKAVKILVGYVVVESASIQTGR